MVVGDVHNACIGKGTSPVCLVTLRFFINNILKKLRRLFKIAIAKCSPRVGSVDNVNVVGGIDDPSVATIFTAAMLAILISFVAPFVAFVNSIPSCVMGGVCMALYGFIAVSGLKMIQKIDLEKNRNLFVVSAILIAGIGGLSLTFGKITITTIACALILGILVNIVLSKEKD